ncbi:biotin-dependent carboxyltransferase family protein [Chloroflexota bacterium]
MEIFEVIQPGPLTTIQDLGRCGYQQYGVPVSGAMDNYALRLGNLLVGNNEGEACLEITLLGLQLQILENTVVAITGADLSPSLNGISLPMWEAVILCKGDIVSLPWPKNGCRAYLAVSGGIEVPKVMGSASTYTKAQLGGLGGRALRAGDRLRTGKPQSLVVGRKVPAKYIPEYGNNYELRVLMGPQDDYFTEQGIYTFVNSEYVISAEADRMGYRLEGLHIEHKDRADIISDGIPLGAVQVPGDGLPIILLADRQATGGYTKIATVASADIPKIAQAKPGNKVKFTRITVDEAHKALREYERTIYTLKGLIQE